MKRVKNFNRKDAKYAKERKVTLCEPLCTLRLCVENYNCKDVQFGEYNG
ncbi:MAG: hypothetical protein ACHQQQ_02000 [Bacteroidota bacterium]